MGSNDACPVSTVSQNESSSIPVELNDKIAAELIKSGYTFGGQGSDHLVSATTSTRERPIKILVLLPVGN